MYQQDTKPLNRSVKETRAFITSEMPTLTEALRRVTFVGFPTTLGAWGPLLSGYYDASRVEIPGELRFWSNIVKPHMDVLEIGAGTGFISISLAAANPRTLTLVEPEKENIVLLEARLLKQTLPVIPEIQTCKFEIAQVRKQDFILFPYDRLSMITDAPSRSKIFEIVHKNLKSGGLFGLHISPPSWVHRHIETSPTVQTTMHTTFFGLPIITKRTIRQISDTEYVKFISIENQVDGSIENYLALTSAVTTNEIIEASRTAGFKLKERFSNFSGSTHKLGLTDDDIFIFEKRST